jgi:hypothetical protein
VRGDSFSVGEAGRAADSQADPDGEKACPPPPQGYRLTLAAEGVEVAAGGQAGLFYGAATLAQLLAGDGRVGRLPAGTITDWPEYPLRIVHWDTKHHQDRPETLRRLVDQAARLKFNAVAFELEDKFAYPSHPAIGQPRAFTPDQLRELTEYALARHVQIIPDVQAPAHMAYVLKHDQYAHLRCDGSNYQVCMAEPAARELIFQMYADLIDATPGVEYFLISTDEVYYAGICEKDRPYNPENRSQTWVDFARAACEFVLARGRRPILWAEYPLLARHVEQLPPEAINGVMTPTKDDDMVAALNAHGMDSLLYCPVEGNEKLFPDYFDTAGPDGRIRRGRIAATVDHTCPRVAGRGRTIGTFAAAWDDAGLHNETFWPGWAAMAAGSWNPGAAPTSQLIADFADIYLGRRVTGMAEVYRTLQTQARFWQEMWEWAPSRVRPPAYGNSAGKGPRNRRDMTLSQPALPELPDLAFEPAFSTRYADTLGELPRRLADSDRLLGMLQANLTRADRNRYHLEVLLSIARLIRSHLELLAAAAGAEDVLAKASAAADDEPRTAVGLMVAARDGVGEALANLSAVHAALVEVWERSQLPRNAPADGREFLHVGDDVKDHFADRRADLTYLTAPAEGIGLTDWCDRLGRTIQDFAASHELDATALDEEPMDD